MSDSIKPQRLDKWISSQGQWSRSQVKDLVRTGQVTVNGVKAVSPEQKLLGDETVFVGTQQLRLQRFVYIMMNKPAGVVCATRDNHDRTVLGLLPPALRRPGLFPAGRLDKDTEGFVLITDDGDFAHKILSPKGHVPKKYYAVLDKEIDYAYLKKEFERGISLDGGDMASPALLETDKNTAPAQVFLTIYEGMYHQVKRMFMRYGLTVTYLKRVRIGGLDLDPSLACGECREILYNEIAIIC